MAIFIKERTLIRQICFMALMSAINVVFSVITEFVPFMGVALVIFLPLTSALVETICENKYFPIYAFATIGLSIVVSGITFSVTLFYIIPSIASGFIFGFMNKKNQPDYLSVFTAAVVQTGLSFLAIPLMNFITETNFIDDLCLMLKINNIELFKNYLLLIFFLVSLAQTILSYIVVYNEMKRLKLNVEKKNINVVLLSYFSILSIIISILFSLIYVGISYVFVCFAWYFAAFIVFEACKSKNKLFLTIFGSILLLNFFLYAVFNHLVPAGYEMLLLGISPLLIGFENFVFLFLKKKKCSIK